MRQLRRPPVSLAGSSALRQEHRGRSRCRHQHSLSCSRAGDVKQLPFLLGELVTVCIVCEPLKDVPSREVSIVAAYYGNGSKLQPLGAVHGSDRNSSR